MLSFSQKALSQPLFYKSVSHNVFFCFSSISQMVVKHILTFLASCLKEYHISF